MQQNCLIRKILVVTPADGGGIVVIPDAYVAVADGIIVYVGQSEKDAGMHLGKRDFETYDGRKRLLLPAFANIHGHLPMTLFRNQADDRNLQDWLFNVIFPREAHLSAEVTARGSRLAMAEMIRSGTGAAAEMYYYHDAVAQAAAESGFRLNLCCDAKTADENGQAGLDPQIIRRTRANWENDLLKISLLVHSVYLYEPRVYPLLAELALAEKLPVQVHISETAREVEDCLARYGRRPPAQLEEFGLLQTPTIAAHCVHLDANDRLILARNRVVVAHNPASNLKLGSGIADVAALLEQEVRVGIGTDGAASNNSLDMYKEMRLASLLAKGRTGEADRLPAETVLRMATADGMEALGFAGCGMIRDGWQADLQIVDLDRPEMTPLGNPAAALVYSCSGGAVESLMVAGRWLMRKRELTTMDEEKICCEARETAAWINRY